eukprot:127504_1
MSKAKMKTISVLYVLGPKNSDIWLRENNEIWYFNDFTQIRVNIQIEQNVDGKEEFKSFVNEIKKKNATLSQTLHSLVPFTWKWKHFEVGRVFKRKFVAAVEETYSNKKIEINSWVCKVKGPYLSNIYRGYSFVLCCEGDECCDLSKMINLKTNTSYIGKGNLQKLQNIEKKQNKQNNDNKENNDNKKNKKKKQTQKKR